jgi:hypothetical protein
MFAALETSSAVYVTTIHKVVETVSFAIPQEAGCRGLFRSRKRYRFWYASRRPKQEHA